MRTLRQLLIYGLGIGSIFFSSSIIVADPIGHTDTVSIHKLNELNFGTIYSGPIAGTVTITPTGILTCRGGVFIEMSHQILSSSASFSLVTTNPNTKLDQPNDRNIFPLGESMLSIVLPTTVDLRAPNGEIMTADKFTFLRIGTTMNVGATLHVNANQPSGSYQGVFFITGVVE
jgi:hypothetical protein